MSKLESEIKVANATQPHCAVVLLLDVSGSMAGNIEEVTSGLDAFRSAVAGDPLASVRVDLAVVTFGGSVTVAHEFSSIKNFEAPLLSAGGDTPMGEAILRGLDMVEERKRQYKTQGIDYYRPWVFLMTDGEPTDMSEGDSRWREVTARVRDGETQRKFMFFAVAVEGANVATLGAIAPPSRQPVKLNREPGAFKKMFDWLSNSLGSAGVAGSSPGDELRLQDPVIAGWARIPSA